jgi:hypothetical protein
MMAGKSGIVSGWQNKRQQPHHVIAAEFIRPSNQSAITRDLIVLDRLCGADDGGIENLLVGDLAGNIVRFRNETVDRGTLHALRLLAEFLEHLVEPRDLILRFFEVIA